MGTHATGRLGQLRMAVVMAAVILFAGFAAVAPQSAHQASANHGNGWRALPTHYGSGYVVVDSSSSGRAQWARSSGCVYIQVQHVAVAGLNSTWDRLTSNNCSGSWSSTSWYHPTSRAFNGFKFRLCKDIAYQPDSCGGSVTIYYTT